MQVKASDEKTLYAVFLADSIRDYLYGMGKVAKAQNPESVFTYYGAIPLPKKKDSLSCKEFFNRKFSNNSGSISVSAFGQEVFLVAKELLKEYGIDFQSFCAVGGNKSVKLPVSITAKTYADDMTITINHSFFDKAYIKTPRFDTNISFFEYEHSYCLYTETAEHPLSALEKKISTKPSGEEDFKGEFFSREDLSKLYEENKVGVSFEIAHDDSINRDRAIKDFQDTIVQTFNIFKTAIKEFPEVAKICGMSTSNPRATVPMHIDASDRLKGWTDETSVLPDLEGPLYKLPFNIQYYTQNKEDPLYSPLFVSKMGTLVYLGVPEHRCRYFFIYPYFSDGKNKPRHDYIIFDGERILVANKRFDDTTSSLLYYLTKLTYRCTQDQSGRLIVGDIKSKEDIRIQLKSDLINIAKGSMPYNA